MDTPNPAHPTRLVRLPYSEVCMHMRVAGRRAMVEILTTHRYPSAQIWLDGRRYSTPVTLGEAGIGRMRGADPHDANAYYVIGDDAGSVVCG